MAIVINGALLSLGGADALAAYSIVLYIDSILISALYGIQDAMQPVISYNYGAKLLGRINQLFKLNCIVGFSLSAICLIGMLIFSNQLIGFFTNPNDLSVISNAKIALYLFAPSYLFVWYIMVTSAFLTSFDKPEQSVMITLLRSIILPLISLLIMSSILKVYGIYITPLVASSLTCIFAYYIWKNTYQSIKVES